jgi:hypothetical protein
LGFDRTPYTFNSLRSGLTPIAIFIRVHLEQIIKGFLNEKLSKVLEPHRIPIEFVRISEETLHGKNFRHRYQPPLEPYIFFAPMIFYGY